VGPADPSPSPSHPGWVAPALAALAVLVSGLGLFCTRVGVYDDSLLLLGARLVGAGRLPYRDFYTHYGPLGYFVLEPVMRWVGNPGLALRLAQALGLTLLSALLLLQIERSGTRPSRAAFPLAALALSAAFALAAFLGFGLAAATIALYGLARTARGSALEMLALLGAGASLAATALTRPAFAAYAGSSVVALELATIRPGWARRLLLLMAACAVTIAAVWLALFPKIPPRVAVEAMLVTPGRLLTIGKRHLRPHFATAPAGLPVLIGAAIAAAPLLWVFAAPTSRRARLLAAGSIALGAAMPLFLGPCTARLDPVVFAVVQLAIAIAVVVAARASLRESPALWAAAAFGLAASAFGHYYWSRPDSLHLFPAMGLAAASATFVWPAAASSRTKSLAVLAALALPFVPIDEDLGLPVASLSRGGWARAAENAARHGAGPKTIWPAGEFSTPALEAVSLADRLAAPSSRFVAYGSDQAWTAGDPVFLFLLSARLPYTRWFQYDPGLQNTAPIQAEMLREIEASGSATAVVWRSEEYRYDPPPPGPVPARSEFDARIERIYGRIIARIGSFEVRAREDPAWTAPRDAGSH
jgi:hypothetical protein